MTLIFTDFFILGFLTISTLTGILRGALLEAGALMCWVIAFVLTVAGAPVLAPLTDALGGPSSIVSVAMMLICFLLLLVVLRIALGFGLKLFGAESHGLVSRAFGGVIGAGRGLMIICLAYLATLVVWTPSQLPPWVQNAQSQTLIQNFSEQIVAALPDMIVDIETASLMALISEVKAIEEATDVVDSIAHGSLPAID